MQKICVGDGFHSLGSVLCKKEKVQKFVLESDSILWKRSVQKGKSVVQESLLDFGTHPLGSVLCNRKRCGVK